MCVCVCVGTQVCEVQIQLIHLHILVHLYTTHCVNSQLANTIPSVCIIFPLFLFLSPSLSLSLRTCPTRPLSLSINYTETTKFY